MRNNLITELNEAHRDMINTHRQYLSIMQGYYSNSARNLNRRPNQTNVGESDYLFRTSLPPITIDLTTLFNQNNTNTTTTIPTEEQINAACEVLEFRDIHETERTTEICPIDRQPLNPTDSVMRIRECRHYFRESNLRQSFESSSLCPMCRNNII